MIRLAQISDLPGVRTLARSVPGFWDDAWRADVLGYRHQIGDFVMAALAAGFRIDAVDERAPDVDFARRWPRAEKYVGWPMLVVLRMTA